MRKALDFIRVIPSHFRRGKHCVVIEETGCPPRQTGLPAQAGGINVTETYIADSDGSVKFINVLHGDTVGDFKRPLFKADFLVLAMNGKNATTVQNTARVSRADKTRPINTEEYEEILFRALSEFFNTYRAFSAKKMSIPESRTVLFDASVSEMAVDGRKVVDLTDISGKEISVRLRGTFMSEEKAREANRLASWANKVFPVEANGALAVFISGKKDTALFCEESSTSAFNATSDRVVYEGEADWKISSVTEGIKKALAISDNDAIAVLNRFANAEMSKQMSNFIDGIFEKYMAPFVKSVGDSIKKHGRMNAPVMHLVFSIPVREGLGWLKHSNYFRINSLEEKLNASGFRIVIPEKQAKNIKSKNISVRTAALAVYPFAFPRNENADKILYKRAKWFM